jgi:hypothetical protein
MTPYLFVVAFLVFILGTVGPILITMIYEFFIKKFGIFIDPKTNQVLRNPKFLKIAELISDCKPKKMLSRACFFFGLMSILVSASLMLAVGFESDQTRDLGLFIGLWASTLFGLANYLKK